MGQKSSGCPVCGARHDERAVAELDAEESFWAEYESGKVDRGRRVNSHEK